MTAIKGIATGIKGELVVFDLIKDFGRGSVPIIDDATGIRSARKNETDVILDGGVIDNTELAALEKLMRPIHAIAVAGVVEDITVSGGVDGLPSAARRRTQLPGAKYRIRLKGGAARGFVASAMDQQGREQ